MLLAPPLVVNVSHVRADQAETAVAIDPRNARVLVSGSVSIDLGRLGRGPVWTTRTYTSTDGGSSWRGSSGPPAPAGASPRCAAQSDPSLAITPGGTELDAFVTDVTCSGRRLVFVARRRNASAAWQTSRLPVLPERDSGARRDDKPVLAVDPTTGRAYIAFQTGEGANRSLLLAASDDSGATWTNPHRVGVGSSATLAVSAGGFVNLAYATEHAVVVTQSRDGGATFPRSRRFAILRAAFRPPAQARRGVTTTPGIAVNGDRILVTWTDGSDQNPGVRSAFLGSDLRLVASPTIVASSAILPAVAADPTNSLFWDCFYATRRTRVAETCATTIDGVRWRFARISRWSRAPATAFQLGDYASVATALGVAHPVWAARSTGGLGTDVFTAAVSRPPA